MDQAFIPAVTALIVALSGLATAIVTLIKVLQHGVLLTETRNAVNGQAAKLDASIGVMQVENAKRSANPT